MTKPLLWHAAALLALGAAPAALAAQRDTTAAAPRADSARLAAADSAARPPLRLCAGGDVTLGTNLGGWNGGRLAEPDSLLAPLRPLFAAADVALVNVEGAIGEGPAPSKCGPNSTACFAFRMPLAAAAAFARLGGDSSVVVGNLANNHAGDAGAAGLRATARHLRDAGVAVTGTDTLATVVVTPRGDTLAVLGFSTSAGPDPRDLPAVRRHVARAAERHAVVVVTMHMGAEGRAAQRTLDRRELFLGSLDRGNPVAFARAAIEAGADLVVGHGPHVLRALEWHRERLAVYSLGNLVNYGPFSLAEPMNRGAVLCVALDAEGTPLDGRLYPTQQTARGRVRLDPAARAVVLVDSLSTLDFGQSAARLDADGTLRLPARLAERPAEQRPKTPATAPR